MERAGYGVHATLRRRYRPLRGRHIWIICGRGNNGGDGLVVGRLLHDDGLHPRVLLACAPEEITGDAQLQLEPLRRRGMLLEVLGEDGLGMFAGLSRDDILIDALFGTGLRGPLSGFAARLVEAMNASRAVRVSIDIPSGLSADTGEVQGPAVFADRTVTMAARKRSFSLHPARLHVGAIEVVDIGIPDEVIAGVGPKVREIGQGDVRRCIRPFDGDAHKGTRGKLLIVGGSPGLTGAVCLTAVSALRSGAGLVRAAVPRGVNSIVETKLTEAMSFPVVETEIGTVSSEALEFLLGLQADWDAIAVGPGMGRHPSTDRLVRELYALWKKPIVIDADGLNALAASPDGLPPRKDGVTAVLTPHPGEMARLSRDSIAEIRRDPIGVATRFAAVAGAVVLLKGAPTTIVGPEGNVLLNPTGNPGLATGGSGDVLTGIIGALLAGGVDPIDAAACGAFLHGESADRLAGRTGERGVVPGAVAEGLAAIWSAWRL
jgi:NAD(P)H-hydrate epimerase